MDASDNAPGDAVRRRWKRLVTAIGWASIASWCGAVGFIIYMAPSRQAPDFAAGRVYGWANHGGSVYLSRCEDVLVKATMVLAAVLFIAMALIEHKTDPWRRRSK